MEQLSREITMQTQPLKLYLTEDFQEAARAFAERIVRESPEGRAAHRRELGALVDRLVRPAVDEHRPAGREQAAVIVASFVYEAAVRHTQGADAAAEKFRLQWTQNAEHGPADAAPFL